MLETNKKLKTKTNKSFLEEVPILTEAKCRTMQIARWKAEAAARPGSRPTRAGRRRRQGGGQLRGGARVREAPRSSQAAAAAGRQAAQPRAHS